MVLRCWNRRIGSGERLYDCHSKRTGKLLSVLAAGVALGMIPVVQAYQAVT